MSSSYGFNVTPKLRYGESAEPTVLFKPNLKIRSVIGVGGIGQIPYRGNNNYLKGGLEMKKFNLCFVS